MPDLKPCPFCGAAATIERANEEPAVWVVSCPSYACLTTKAGTSQSEAIAAWNQRAPGWQPMETAPRGVTILALADNGMIGQAHWEEDIGRHVSGMSTRHTHWMPLPPAPAAEEAAKR